MDPNQQPDRSIDYLNQIAPQQKVSLLPNKFFIIGIGAALVIGLLIIVFGSLNQAPSLETRVTALYTRLQTLQTIGTNQQGQLKDSGLRASNSALNLLLTDASQSIGKSLQGGNKKFVVPPDLVTSEKSYLDKLTEKFNDARLNVDLDRTYAREITYQLSLVQNMIQSMLRQGPTKSLADLLTNTLEQITPLQQTFAEFSGSKE